MKSNRVTACILAGGLSRRMGRDKSRMRLGRRTLLGHIRASAKQLELPVRVIRRDLVARSGPLGGVLTALRELPSGMEHVLFLSCDMPLVTPELLGWILERYGAGDRALFVEKDQRAGFPFVMGRRHQRLVEGQWAAGHWSMQSLAQALNAQLIRVPVDREAELLNINTPTDWAWAREHWRDILPR